MKQPRQLDHYTSFDNLECIINNKSIRFNALKNVDDQSEGETLDLGKLGHIALISCWTDSEYENGGMCFKYGDNYKGVIIRASTKLFDKYGMGCITEKNAGNNKVKLLYENHQIKITTAIRILLMKNSGRQK